MSAQEGFERRVIWWARIKISLTKGRSEESMNQYELLTIELVFFKTSKYFFSCQLLEFEGKTLPTLKSMTLLVDTIARISPCEEIQILRYFYRRKFPP